MGTTRCGVMVLLALSSLVVGATAASRNCLGLMIQARGVHVILGAGVPHIHLSSRALSLAVS